MFGVEIEACARCGGKLKIVASIEEPQVIAHILAHLEKTDAAYWTELQHGLRLGHRKGKTGAGVWVLREFRGGRYVRRRLGIADDLVLADGTAVLSYADAQKLALTSDRPTLSQPGKHTVSELERTAKVLRGSGPSS